MPSVSSVQVAQFGIENKFIQGEPSMTFFKSVVKKHTNFATETMAVNFDNPPEMGSINTITIPRNGDLVQKVYLKVYYPEILPVNPLARWCSCVAQALVEYAELVIGGEVIQKINDIEAFIQSEFRTPDAQYPALQALENRYRVRQYSDVAQLAPSGTFYTQLLFYFHWHTSLALPLVALKHQEIQIRLKFRNVNELIQTTNGSGIHADTGTLTQPYMKFTPCVEYIFLDDTERNRYMSGKQYDYIIEQNQHITVNSSPMDISFTGMIKEIVFVAVDTFGQQNNYFNFWFGTGLNTDSWVHWWSGITLTFNQQPILLPEFPINEYLKLVQPMEYHTRVPGSVMYSWSFANDPESLDPTGAANFSRIRSVVLTCSTRWQVPVLYATSVNIYRICDNLGALVFKE